MAAVDNAVQNPNAGNIFDAALTPVGDALAGFSAGTAVGAGGGFRGSIKNLARDQVNIYLFHTALIICFFELIWITAPLFQFKHKLT